MKFLWKVIKTAFVIIILFVALLAVLGVTLVPSYGKKMLLEHLGKELKKEVSIGSFYYYPLKGFVIENAEVFNDDGIVFLNVNELTINIRWTALLFGKITVDHPQIQFNNIFVHPRKLTITRNPKNTLLTFVLTGKKIVVTMELKFSEEKWIFSKISLIGQNSSVSVTSRENKQKNENLFIGGGVMDLSDINGLFSYLKKNRKKRFVIHGELQFSHRVGQHAQQGTISHANGTLTMKNVMSERVCLDKVRGEINYDKKVLVLKRCHVTGYEGTLEAELKFDFTDTGTLNGTIRVADLNLEELASTIMSEEENFLGGILNADASFTDSGITPETLAATVFLKVTDGHFVEVDALKILFMLFRFIQPDLGKLVFRDIQGNLEILEGRVQSSDLKLDSNVITLQAIGTLWFNGDVDCSFKIKPYFSKGIISSIIKAGVSLIAGQVVKLRMTGKIPDVKILNDYIPVIDNIPGIHGLRKTAGRNRRKKERLRKNSPDSSQ